MIMNLTLNYYFNLLNFIIYQKFLIIHLKIQNIFLKIQSI